MRTTLLAAAALALVGSAQAADFVGTVTGSGLYQYVDPADSIGVPGGCNPVVNPNSTACQFGFVDITWSGRLDVVTDGTNGTFTDSSGGIESITFSSDWGSFSWNAGDTPRHVLPGEPGGDFWLVGLVSSAQVTIANSRITSFSALYHLADETFTFSGLTAKAQSANGGENSNGFRVAAPLFPVPEPTVPVMLGAGVAFLILRQKWLSPRRA